MEGFQITGNIVAIYFNEIRGVSDILYRTPELRRYRRYLGFFLFRPGGVDVVQQ